MNRSDPDPTAPVFAVVHSYAADRAQRKFVPSTELSSELGESLLALALSPQEGDGALLLVRAETKADVADILAKDPFRVANLTVR